MRPSSKTVRFANPVTTQKKPPKRRRMRGDLTKSPLDFPAPVRHNPVLRADDELQHAILQIYVELSFLYSLSSGDLRRTEPQLEMAVSTYEGIVTRMIPIGDAEGVFSRITSAIEIRLHNFSTAVSSNFEGLLFLEKISNEWDTFCRAFHIIVQPFKLIEDGSLVGPPPFTILGGKILSLWMTIMLTTDQMKMNFKSSFLQVLRHFFDKSKWETLDTGMIIAIQGTLQMLVFLDVRLYEQFFEGVFLEHARGLYDYYSRRFLNLVQKDNITAEDSVLCLYRQEPDAFLEKDNIRAQHSILCLYLQEAETFLQNDTARGAQVLPLETRSKFLSIFETKMIEEHLYIIFDELPNMLQWNKCEDLKRISNLLAGLHSQCLQRMCGIVSTHIHWEGRDIFEQAKDRLDYVERFVQLTLKYDKILAESFQNEVTLTEAVAYALKRVIGWNTSTTEFVSLFLDNHLRKNFDNIFPAYTEEFLDGIVSVLNYLDQKEFVQHFEKHRQIRFLSGCALSQDVERKIVTTLAKHGFEFSACTLQDIPLQDIPTRNSGFVVDSVVDVNYPKSSVKA